MTGLGKYYAQAEQVSNEDIGVIPEVESGVLIHCGQHNEHARKLSILATGAHLVTGARHRYDITGFDARTNPAFHPTDHENILTILFQQGPVPNVGINGVTPEALLLCVQHLFEGYQTSTFKCQENEDVLEGVGKAIAAIRARTAGRVERGVEGTHNV